MFCAFSISFSCLRVCCNYDMCMCGLCVLYCMYVCIYVSVRVCCMCVYVYVHVCVCACVCVCVCGGCVCGVCLGCMAKLLTFCLRRLWALSTSKAALVSACISKDVHTHVVCTCREKCIHTQNVTTHKFYNKCHNQFSFSNYECYTA